MGRSSRSRRAVQRPIDDYAARTEQTVKAWNSINGQQGGDPAKLANALIPLASQGEPPLRFVAGADAVATVESRTPSSERVEEPQLRFVAGARAAGVRNIVYLSHLHAAENSPVRFL